MPVSPEVEVALLQLAEKLRAECNGSVKELKSELKDDLAESKKSRWNAGIILGVIGFILSLAAALGISSLVSQAAKTQMKQVADDLVSKEGLKKLKDTAEDAVTKITSHQKDIEKVHSELSARALVPPGSVLAFAGTDVPDGFLMCDGTAKDRNRYSVLFNILQTTHGRGDGVKTFNLPDYRGRFLRGVDGNAGQDPDSGARTPSALGGTGGNNVGSVQLDEFNSHTHMPENGSSLMGSGGPVLSDFGGYVVGQQPFKATSLPPKGGKETRPKNVYVNYIIKF